MAKRARKPADIRLGRVYTPPSDDDGLRVLVDRLWPRGIAKEKARVDLWLKDIAPSDALRRRAHTDPGKWDDFIADYARELNQPPAAMAATELLEHIRRGPVTLLYASRDEKRNNAVALKAWLEQKVKS